MPDRNGAVVRGPAPPMARTRPVRSLRSSEDAADLGDGGNPAVLTQHPPDAVPLVEPAGFTWDSAGPGQVPAPVPTPDR